MPKDRSPSGDYEDGRLGIHEVGDGHREGALGNIPGEDENAYPPADVPEDVGGAGLGAAGLEDVHALQPGRQVGEGHGPQEITQQQRQGEFCETQELFNTHESPNGRLPGLAFSAGPYDTNLTQDYVGSGWPSAGRLGSVNGKVDGGEPREAEALCNHPDGRGCSDRLEGTFLEGSPL